MLPSVDQALNRVHQAILRNRIEEPHKVIIHSVEIDVIGRWRYSWKCPIAEVSITGLVTEVGAGRSWC